MLTPRFLSPPAVGKRGCRQPPLPGYAVGNREFIIPLNQWGGVEAAGWWCVCVSGRGGWGTGRSVAVLPGKSCRAQGKAALRQALRCYPFLPTPGILRPTTWINHTSSVCVFCGLSFQGVINRILRPVPSLLEFTVSWRKPVFCNF